jgi:hypothetical protein
VTPLDVQVVSRTRRPVRLWLRVTCDALEVDRSRVAGQGVARSRASGRPLLLATLLALLGGRTDRLHRANHNAAGLFELPCLLRRERDLVQVALRFGACLEAVPREPVQQALERAVLGCPGAVRRRGGPTACPVRDQHH